MRIAMKDYKAIIKRRLELEDLEELISGTYSKSLDYKFSSIHRTSVPSGSVSARQELFKDYIREDDFLSLAKMLIGENVPLGDKEASLAYIIKRIEETISKKTDTDKDKEVDVKTEKEVFKLPKHLAENIAIQVFDVFREINLTADSIFQKIKSKSKSGGLKIQFLKGLKSILVLPIEQLPTTVRELTVKSTIKAIIATLGVEDEQTSKEIVNEIYEWLLLARSKYIKMGKSGDYVKDLDEVLSISVDALERCNLTVKGLETGLYQKNLQDIANKLSFRIFDLIRNNSRKKFFFQKGFWNLTKGSAGSVESLANRLKEIFLKRLSNETDALFMLREGDERIQKLQVKLIDHLRMIDKMQAGFDEKAVIEKADTSYTEYNLCLISSGKKPEKGNLYVKRAENSLQYQVMDLYGEVFDSVLMDDELSEIAPELLEAVKKEPFNIINLKPFLFSLLEIIEKRGHLVFSLVEMVGRLKHKLKSRLITIASSTDETELLANEYLIKLEKGIDRERSIRREMKNEIVTTYADKFSEWTRDDKVILFGRNSILGRKLHFLPFFDSGKDVLHKTFDKRLEKAEKEHKEKTAGREKSSTVTTGIISKPTVATDIKEKKDLKSPKKESERRPQRNMYTELAEVLKARQSKLQEAEDERSLLDDMDSQLEQDEGDLAVCDTRSGSPIPQKGVSVKLLSGMISRSATRAVPEATTSSTSTTTITSTSPTTPTTGTG